MENNENELINSKIEQEDDGSLDFLNIPPDRSRKQFNCKDTTQQKLVNSSFWVIDYFDEVKTKYGQRALVKIKINKTDSDEDSLKFFTNSADIKYILEEIKKRNAFPRKVTLKSRGNHFYFI